MYEWHWMAAGSWPKTGLGWSNKQQPMQLSPVQRKPQDQSSVRCAFAKQSAHKAHFCEPVHVYSDGDTYTD